MKTRFFFLFLYVFWLPHFAKAQQIVPEWLTRLYTQLETQNKDLQIAKMNTAFNIEELTVSEAYLYPSLSLSGSAGKSKNQNLPVSSTGVSTSTGSSSSSGLGVDTSNPTTTSNSTSTDGISAQLSMNYTLFSQFAVSENIKKSENSVQQAKLQENANRIKKKAQLIQLLTQWQWLVEVEPLLHSAQKILQQVEEHSNKKAKNLYSDSDWLDLEEKRAKIALTIIKFEEGKELVKKALIDLISDLDFNTLNDVPVFTINYKPPTSIELLNLYKEKSDSWKISQLQIDTARRTERVTDWQRPYIPIVSTSLSQAYSRPYESDKTSDSWSAQVVLTFNLFDGFSQSARRQQAKIAHSFTQAKADSEAQKKVVYLQHERMKALVANAEFNEKNVNIKKKVLQKNDVLKKHDQGVAGPLEIALADLEVAKSKIDALEALKDFQVSLLNIATELNEFDKIIITSDKRTN
jgi:outer membrane protein TolC